MLNMFRFIRIGTNTTLKTHTFSSSIWIVYTIHSSTQLNVSYFYSLFLYQRRSIEEAIRTFAVTMVINSKSLKFHSRFLNIEYLIYILPQNCAPIYLNRSYLRNTRLWNFILIMLAFFSKLNSIASEQL